MTTNNDDILGTIAELERLLLVLPMIEAQREVILIAIDTLSKLGQEASQRGDAIEIQEAEQRGYERGQAAT